MNVKVVHLTTVHPPFDTRIFHKEAKSLVRAGYNVTLIAQHERDVLIDGVKVIALPRPKNRLKRIFRLTWRAFRLALRERADIYHFHDPELLIIGMLLKLLTRGKVIYDVHEDVPQQILTKYWIPSPLRWPVSILFNALEKSIARFFDAVITATEGIAEKFKGLDPVIVHNYPDLSLISNAPLSLYPEREKILIYIGGISRLRGASEIVQALGYLDHIDKLRLDLIGEFETRAFEKELQAFPGYKRVRFLGWLQPEAVYKHLRSADIGLVCLHPEPRYIVGWPIKLFEYMAAGLPVIASDFPLWKEIVEGNGCGLCVDPLNPKAIAAAIEYLISHPEDARRMGENGRRAVLEKYNWDREAEKLLKLYKKLLLR